MDEIETMLDQPAAESLKKLEDKSAIIHDQNDQLNTLEGEITGIIDEIKKLADVSRQLFLSVFSHSHYSPAVNYTKAV